MVSTVPDVKADKAERRLKTATQVALNVRSLHPDLRKRFKLVCVRKGIPMEQAVIQLIEGVVSGNIALSG